MPVQKSLKAYWRHHVHGDRDEMINPILSECSKSDRSDYKTRHDRVGNMIHLELCKKLKFDHANKWYVHNQESVLENETDKILWHFAIKRLP